MKSKKNKLVKKDNKIRHFVKIIFAIISCYCIWNILFTQIEIKKQTKILNQIKEKYAHEINNNDEYEELLSLESDEGYIKRIARETLDFINPTDRVFIDISSK